LWGKTSGTLTDAVVRDAVMPPGKRQHYLYDTTTHPGLAVRMRERGGRTFVYFFSLPGCLER
jgi:hypothetical protein